jgi:hypothetical protein
MQSSKFFNSKVKMYAILLFMTMIPFSGFAQLRNAEVHKYLEKIQSSYREIIRLPNLDGYVTLKCDFHTHTVFSDGQVTPMVRVNEAWSDGLDAIAITDHIEYRPFKDITNPDFNKSNEMGVKYGESIDFIVIKGAEITRKKPIGHLNALFIEDVNKLKQDDPVDAIKEAVKQGAFVMWNHPGWPNDSTTMYDIHRQLIKEKLIHGVELFNAKEWYPRVLSWGKETGLTLMGNSDMHHTIRNNYGGEKMARPMTLVFAKEKSEKGIKEALFEGRTLVLFFKILAGKEDLLKSFVDECIDVKVIDKKKSLIEATNNSDVEFTIKYGNNLVILAPNKVTRLNLQQKKEVLFSNCFTGEEENLVMALW